MDSIIVHGAGGKIARNRVDTALEVYYEEPTKLIFTGKDCAKQMKDYASKKGVSKDDMLLEENSRDTITDMFFTKLDYLKPNDWKKNIVVSSEWHLPRLSMVFDRVLGENYYTRLFGSHDLEGEELRRAKIKEHIYYILDRFVLFNVKSGDDKAIGRRIESFYNSLDLLSLR